MKKLALLLFLILSLSAHCQQQFTINGKLPDNSLDGKTVYLKTLDNNFNFVISDSIQVNGERFQLNSSSGDVPEIAFLVFDENTVRESNIPHTMVILEAGSINAEMANPFKVSGTARNEEFQEFYNQQNELVDKIYTLNNQGALNAKDYQDILDQIKDLNYTYIRKNIDNKIGEFFLIDMYQLLDQEQIAELLKEAREEFITSEIGKKLQLMVNSQELRVGDEYMDITLPNPEGEEISISDFIGKNKLVLLDFWASWCGPCLREMPNFVRAYIQYKDKGLEIIGISLDDNRENFKNALDRYNITWPQMSDFGGWNSKAAHLYRVNVIPYTLLLDADGKIIAKNLRGEELLNKLDELLQ